jgi:KaiC/GvpD/RAD55 family RecA-like ATPase
MVDALVVPLLKELVPGGIDYGSVLLVEFEPHSCWYDAAYTIAAQALRDGVKTDVHIFQHTPREVRACLSRFGLDLKKLEAKDLFRFIDSFTVQIGIGAADVPKGADAFKTQSVKLEDWGKAAGVQIATEIQESEKKRLHIDDNTVVLTRYNTEQEVVDYWRTRIIPLYKSRGSILVNAVALGTASDSFYRQHESMSDVIVDFRSREENGRMEHYVRVRSVRGKSPDSRWRHVRVNDGEVVLDMDHHSPTDLKITSQVKNEKEVSSMLSELNDLRLSRYRVVGSYTRYDESVRNLLKDLNQKIATGLESGQGNENYLLWAPPGSGKSFFVQQVHESLGDRVKYYELNFGEMDEQKLRSTLLRMEESDMPSLCLIDEVDSRSSETWPFEALLTSLENRIHHGHRVFVLAGSSGQTMENMEKLIMLRRKGPDLLSRIPHQNKYSLPPMTPEDRMVVAAANIRRLGKISGKRVVDIEKLALYYMALSPQLDSARQLREFVTRCLDKIPAREDRVKYDNLFEPGDARNKEFWLQARSQAPKLMGSFVRIED